jgi:hypothetical protein
VWLQENVSAPSTDPTAYLAHLRERYGVAESEKGGQRIKGVGQLARTIDRLATGKWRARDFDPTRVNRILPVLLVHDIHLEAAVHPHFLAQEFVAALVPAAGISGWGEMMVGSLQVGHLSVLTVDDIEMLETSTERFSLLECLREYAAASPDRMTSFYNFLVTSRFRDHLRYSAWLISKRDHMLDGLITRLFPDAGSLKTEGA